MLLIVPPAYIRLNCGFPAASDGALECVNQAIRRDVTQLDMSVYYTMMSKLTRHGTDAPSEPVPCDDEPVRAEGSPRSLMIPHQANGNKPTQLPPATTN